MTLTLNSRITAYTALTGGALAAATGTVEAQVRVTNLDPDVTITGDDESYDIDLNGDSTAELTLQRYTDSTYGIQFTGAFIYGATSSVRFIGRKDTINIFGSGTSANVADVLSTNATIDANADFIGSTDSYTFGLWFKVANQAIGNWRGVTNKYAGFKFKHNNQTHYGWLRLSVNSDAHITLHAFAYEQTPDKGITATTTGIDATPLFADINLYAAGRDIILESSENMRGQLTITDLTGRTVMQRQLNGEQNVRLSPQVNSGVYMVTLRRGSAVMTRKIVLN